MRKLSNGYFAVTLQVDPRMIVFARIAARNGFYGVTDYLNAVLNTARYCEMDEAGESYQEDRPSGEYEPPVSGA